MLEERKDVFNTKGAALLEAGRPPGKQAALLLEAEEAGKVSLSLRDRLGGLLIPPQVKSREKRQLNGRCSEGWGSWLWRGHLKGCRAPLRWTQASWPTLWVVSPSLQPLRSAAPRHPSAPSTQELGAPLCLDYDSSKSSEDFDLKGLEMTCFQCSGLSIIVLLRVCNFMFCLGPLF